MSRTESIIAVLFIAGIIWAVGNDIQKKLQRIIELLVDIKHGTR